MIQTNTRSDTVMMLTRLLALLMFAGISFHNNANGNAYAFRDGATKTIGGAFAFASSAERRIASSHRRRTIATEESNAIAKEEKVRGEGEPTTTICHMIMKRIRKASRTMKKPRKRMRKSICRKKLTNKHRKKFIDVDKTDVGKKIMQHCTIECEGVKSKKKKKKNDTTKEKENEDVVLQEMEASLLATDNEGVVLQEMEAATENEEVVLQEIEASLPAKEEESQQQQLRRPQKACPDMMTEGKDPISELANVACTEDGYDDEQKCHYDYVYTGCTWEELKCETPIVTCTCNERFFNNGKWSCMTHAMQSCLPAPETIALVTASPNDDDPTQRRRRVLRQRQQDQNDNKNNLRRKLQESSSCDLPIQGSSCDPEKELPTPCA